MIPIHIDSAWKGTSDCRDCGIRDMVLFADLNEQDFSEIHTPIDDLAFAADAVLYNEGQQALGLFTLRKGMVKLVRSTADGRERIVRVLRPGDVLGLEALATGTEIFAFKETQAAGVEQDYVETPNDVPYSTTVLAPVARARTYSNRPPSDETDM